MLRDTLRRMEHTLPFTTLSNDQQRWPQVTQEFGDRLVPIVHDLLAALAPMVAPRALSESRQEFIASTQPTVAVVGFRLRPPDDYYARWDRRLPRPADPLGRDATGLKVSLDLCRGFATAEGATAPFLAVDFEVWGAHERAGFAHLLREHRYMVEQLVTRSGATLFTSCFFQNLADAQYASTFEQLLLYYENAVDEENHFALQCKFGVDATQADILLALLPAMVLYDAALGYCLPQPRRGRILEHAAMARAWD